MPLKPPGFVRESHYDSLAEYRQFVAASEERASCLFAELSRLQTFGNLGAAQRADGRATSIGSLYCRKSDGWAVFYTIEFMPFRITVVLAADMSKEKFSAIEARAAKRRPPFA